MQQRTEKVQLHLAETRRVEAFGDWMAVCRCGWTSTPTERLEDARTDGDAHLAEANGWDDDDTEVDYDTAEAAGLDGTGRDGDPRFPYTRRDVREHLARDCAESTHSHCETHNSAWTPGADSCDVVLANRPAGEV